jgi:GAF domain-containing protein
MNERAVEVLLVEDEPAHAELVRRAFEARPDFRLSVAGTLAEARARIVSGAPALVIADWLLPDGEGVELISAGPAEARVPVVLMTSHGNERRAVDAIKSGALDYVVKSDAALADMPHVAERALREWRNLLERQQAELALQRQLQELSVLHAVATAASEASSEDALLERLTAVIGAALYPADFGFVMVDEAAGCMRLHPSYRLARAAEAGAVLAFGRGVIGRTVRTGQPQRAPDVSADPDYVALVPDTRSELCAPLKVGDRVLGVINVESARLDAFSEADERLLATIAGQAANALERLRAQASTHRRVQELTGLNEIAQAFGNLTDVRETYGVLAERIARLIGAQKSGVVLYDPQADEFRVQSPGYGVTDEEVAALRFPLDQVGVVVQRLPLTPRGSLLINARAEMPEAIRTLAEAMNIHSLLTAPLLREGSDIGHVVVANKPGGFSQDDLRLLEVFAAQAAVVIQNARLFAETAEALEREHLLNQLTRTISGTLDLPTLLEQVVRLGAELVGAEAGSLGLLTPDGQTITVRALFNFPASFAATRLSDGEGLAWQIVDTGQSLLLNDYGAHPQALAELLAAGVHSFIGVPVVAGDTPLGALGLFSLNPGKKFGERELALAEVVGRQAGLALQKARLFEAERAARQQAEALRAANLALTRSLDLDVILETFLDFLAQLVPYDTASVWLEQGDSRLTVRTLRGHERWTDVERFQRLTLDYPSIPHLNRLMTRGESVVIADAHQTPGWAPIRGTEYIRSWLGVPLLAEGRVIGLYALDKAEPHFFTMEHQQIAEALSAQAAVAIQNARLFDQVRTGREQLQALSHRLVEVQEAERRHIARELHDEIGQTLTGLKLVLQVVPRLPPEAARTKLQDAVGLVNELMERAHDLSLDLRPAMLDDFGLPSALLWLFERFQKQTGVAVASEFVRLEERLPAEVETTAYRIVQEALTNVARHAKVPEVSVRLLADESTLRIQVQDVGPGFDVNAALAAGKRAGLAGMQERASLLGGWVKIDSAPGTGTQVIAVLPFRGFLESRRHGRINPPGR